MIDAIERNLTLGSAPEAVWAALTDPARIASWFGDDAELEPAQGGEGWFAWEGHGRYAVRIELFDPPHRVTWRWAREPDVPLDDGPSTLVEWVLRPRDDGGTDLELEESGFLRNEDRKENVRGWQHELSELQELLASP